MFWAHYWPHHKHLSTTSFQHVAMQAHQKTDDAYIDSSIKLLELAQNASEIFKKGSNSQKREILKFLLSNSKMQGNTR